MKVEEQKVVGIEYTLFLDDGTVGDETDGEPLYFIYGEGNILPGLEDALKGLKVGDKKTVSIKAEDGYGEYDEEAFEELPLDFFPKDVEVEQGMFFALTDEEGNHVPAIVHEVTKKAIVMNMNHPLAGENLKFEVKVVDVREATPEEIEHGHVHGPEGHHH